MANHSFKKVFFNSETEPMRKLGLLDLPPEVRLMIYLYSMKPSSTTWRRKCVNFFSVGLTDSGLALPRRESPQILRTCSQIEREASALLYQHVSFAFASYAIAKKFAKKRGRNSGMIKKIILNRSRRVNRLPANPLQDTKFISNIESLRISGVYLRDATNFETKDIPFYLYSHPRLKKCFRRPGSFLSGEILDYRLVTEDTPPEAQKHPRSADMWQETEVHVEAPRRSPRF